MSKKTTSSLHGFAVAYYALAVFGVIGCTIIASLEQRLLYFVIGLGSGLIVTWLGLVLDGLYVIAINTERSARIAAINKDVAQKKASSLVSDELPELQGECDG